jgi:hypothetical protein
MDQGAGVGQFGAEVVMVGNDELQAQVARGLRLGGAGDAAIDRDDHGRAALGQRGEGLAVEPVALVQPMRHVVADLGAGEPQRLPKDRRAAYAVGIVVAVDDDGPPLVNRVAHALGGLFGAGQQ